VRRARAVLIFLLCCLPAVIPGPSTASAASMGPIQVTTVNDLRLPASAVPPGFTANLANESGITSAGIKAWYGAKIQKTLDHGGFFMGYQGWLDGALTPNLPFVTYDMYAFGSDRGARGGMNTITGLVQGLETTTLDKSLPTNARTWTDGTETFGPTNQPFSVAEVVFYQGNVLVNVIAYSGGDSSDAISEALNNAGTVAVACNTFLTSKIPSAARTGDLPTASLSVLP
jgi:hypothetical protein